MSKHGGDDTKTVTLRVATLKEVKQRAHISFATPELLTIREAARRAGRDVKAVHGEVHVLLNAGILQIEFEF
jgi:hypothetical protein